MKIEEQVCSLELAKKLKELGLTQDSYFYWREGYHTEESFNEDVSLGKRGVFEGRYRIEAHPKPRLTTADIKWNENDLCRLYDTEYAAFTVGELGEMLPHFICARRVFVGQLMTFKHPDNYAVLYGTLRSKYWKEKADTEADARAKMPICLIEAGLKPVAGVAC